MTVNDFVPVQVFPGALVLAGPADGGVLSTVLRSELFETVDGRTVVLVTFRPGLSYGPRVRVDVEAREWARRLWAWIVEHGDTGEGIPFERDVPAWLREP